MAHVPESPLPSSSHAKVIVLGIDGMDPTLLDQYLAKGSMPHFARLRAQGVYTRLRTTTPPESPVAWSTFATGCNPGKHGLFDFVTRVPGTYMPDLALTKIEGSRYLAQRQGDPFWSLTSADHLPTVVVRCPITFPPDKVHGRMLSGMGVPDLRGSQGTFLYWTTAPVPNPLAMGGRVIHVDNTSGTLNTVLQGPTLGSGDQRKDLTVPLAITRDLAQHTATLTVQKQTFTLKEREWSPWFHVKFKTGFFQSMSAVGRFYLTSITPELELYGSPLNFDPENPPYPISYPERYAKDLARDIGTYHTQGMPEDTWALNEGRLDDDAFLQQCQHIHQEREAMLWHELARYTSGVFVTVFDTVDRIQHMFWRAIDPTHPLYTPEVAQRYGQVIEQWYQRMDGIVGQVLDKIDRDTTLIVLSDHGFASFRRAVHLNSWLREQGLLTLQENRSEGRGYGQDIDWSRTQAYALGIGGMYLNLRGREPQGIVEPGAAAQNLLHDLSARLLTFQDDKTGQPVIRRVLDREAIYHGAEAAHAPDLFLGFHDGYRASWQTAVGGVPRVLIEDNTKKWSGDHIVDPDLVPGVLLVNRPLSLDNPALEDIAPTILKQLGTHIPTDMDGHSLW
ncbi:MAG: phosphodiesterase [Deltaproteobacteria bacterium]|nr:phosphodiesterase [Deltaproteobacteria bacterium]